jgi:protein SCO1/2
MSPTKAISIGVIAALAALGGLLVATTMGGPKNIEIQSGTLLKQPRLIEPFQLADSSGAPFDNARLQGHWSLVFAGFTFCPDVCPTTLATLKTLKSKLDAAQAPVQVVFLSVDPERDTLPILDKYVHYFSPDFIGATGPDAELEKFARSLSLVYAKVPGATADSYTMDHSAALVLINPQAQVAGYFLPPHQVDQLSADLQSVIKGQS